MSFLVVYFIGFLVTALIVVLLSKYDPSLFDDGETAGVIMIGWPIVAFLVAGFVMILIPLLFITVFVRAGEMFYEYIAKKFKKEPE